METKQSKACFKCGVEKPLTEFYRHRMMADGHLNKCKECNKRDVRENRAEKLEYYRAYDRRRGARRTKEDLARYRAENPQKHAAHNEVRKAVARGDLVNPRHCSACGVECRAHAHHDDYSKPLDVRWLCAPCHCAWHKENGEGLNASQTPQEA